ncbi:hypothetical protein F2P81_013329 [Scophthalmus maximus]|uniref:Uncharacterized protein n=1 Tax=Scophthalmus maximus TaxID=52904 RepID=A0A6A4SX30_SCOMX|nr:hypothetical protein F2P81_013329 [Scophthalmus maximus]
MHVEKEHFSNILITNPQQNVIHRIQDVPLHFEKRTKVNFEHKLSTRKTTSVQQDVKTLQSSPSENNGNNSPLVSVCRRGPRPPGGAVDWSLERGAQRREVRLQLVPGLHRSSLLQPCQEANCHLQDVCFLQLGVWLLLDQLWSQETLELLDAAVDSLSA